METSAATAAVIGKEREVNKTETEIYWESVYLELNNLRAEKESAKKTICTLQQKLSSATLSAASVEGRDEKCVKLTGLKWSVFSKLFIFLVAFLPTSSRTQSLPPEDQLFLTLVKLRQNVSCDFLAHTKGATKTTAINYFWKWLDLMFAKIGFLVKWQDMDRIFGIIPPVF